MFLTFHVLRGRFYVSTLDMFFLWVPLRVNQCVTGIWLGRKADVSVNRPDEYTDNMFFL